MAVATETSLRQQLLAQMDQQIREGVDVETAAQTVLRSFSKPARAVELVRECAERWLIEDWRESNARIRQGRGSSLAEYQPADPSPPGDRRVNPDHLKHPQSILQQLWPVGENMWLPLGALRKSDCLRLKNDYRRNARGNLLKARAFGRIAARIPNDDDTVDEYWTEDELSGLLGKAA